MSDNTSAAVIGIAGTGAVAGLGAWLGIMQLQIRDLGSEIDAFKSASAVAVVKAQECEKYVILALQEDEQTDLGGEKIVADFFDKRGCNELEAKK